MCLMSVAAAQTTTEDLERRDQAVGWPKSLDPEKAQSFSHNSSRIAASCQTVFGSLARPAVWPDWLVFVKNVRLVSTPATRVGARFRWTIFGLGIESRVAILEQNRRMGWFSYAPGTVPHHFQSWSLTPSGTGCDVVTEEAGLGPDALRARQVGDTRTHRAHELWLASLKWVAEGGIKSK